MAIISSHVLDSVVGDHARGIRVECYWHDGVFAGTQVFDATADQQGRISELVVIDPSVESAQFELIFHSGAYFRSISKQTGQIMPVVVVRLDLPAGNAKHHIPLVLSPHSYTVWWSGFQAT